MPLQANVFLLVELVRGTNQTSPWSLLLLLSLFRLLLLVFPLAPVPVSASCTAAAGRVLAVCVSCAPHSSSRAPTTRGTCRNALIFTGDSPGSQQCPRGSAKVQPVWQGARSERFNSKVMISVKS